MLVSDLLRTEDLSEVVAAAVAIDHDPGHPHGKLGYAAALSVARGLDPVPVDMEAELIAIEPEGGASADAEDTMYRLHRDEPAPAAPLYRLLGRRHGDPRLHPLVGLDWRQWLAMRVVVPRDATPSRTRIAAQVLYEMTWRGFGPGDRLVLPAAKTGDGDFAVEGPGSRAP